MMTATSLVCMRARRLMTLRCFSSSGSLLADVEYRIHPNCLKIKEKQKQFQVDNGLLIHERGGTRDRILYRITQALALAVIVMIVKTLYTLAYTT